MGVHLVNPSDNSFGTAVITPRWLFVLAAATPQSMGDPILVDESLEQLDAETIRAGDVVGISVHTGNALRGYEVGRLARERGATVVYGGIHATLFPEEPFEQGAAHAVVKGDGDIAWGRVLHDLQVGNAKRIYEGGKIEGEEFLAARWDLMQTDKYMWASVQTIRGCPKHCSFCSVWRTDGQKPRQRTFEKVIDEIIDLRRRGFRFIALADDNFYPVTLTDLRLAREQNNLDKLESLTEIRKERFLLMAELAKLPKDMVFFTQITMESAEDTEYLDAMRRANIKGALVGVEAVTPEGLKAVYKDFNYSGDRLVEQLQAFRNHGIHVLGSYLAKTFSIAIYFAEDWNSQMKIGYARVSTQDQRLNIQLEALKKAGCKRVFREKVTGTYRDRPELNRMLDQLRDGDIVAVWKLDRLARSTRNLLEIVETIGNAGARFQSLSEPWANITTHAGKMIMTIFAGIAEFERDLIRERTGAGRADARRRGVRFGRPKKMNTEQRDLAQRLLKEGKSVRDVARTFSVHPATLYRILALNPG
jgi:DNA invertase Pin-like site-specific DNA recombinase